MTWLARILGRQPQLGAAEQAALAAFQALPAVDGGSSLQAQRFVVVDVESTGLDLSRDRLISIGALAVADEAVQLGAGFEVVVQQQAPSTVDNILVHGIDGTTQTSGTPPAEGLLQFLAFLGPSPLVAFHADFDRIMIGRATRDYLGMTIGLPWIDLAFIAPALYPEWMGRCRALDDWTAVFDIVNPNRHNAVADACATAQLFLVLLARAREKGIVHLRDLLQLEKDQRWLSR